MSNFVFSLTVNSPSTSKDVQLITFLDETLLEYILQNKKKLASILLRKEHLINYRLNSNLSWRFGNSNRKKCNNKLQLLFTSVNHFCHSKLKSTRSFMKWFIRNWHAQFTQLMSQLPNDILNKPDYLYCFSKISEKLLFCFQKYSDLLWHFFGDWDFFKVH